MIGINARAGELPAVREFFELFKTAWEPYVAGRSYTAVIATTETGALADAPVTLVYGADEMDVDRRAGVGVARTDGQAEISWRDAAFPVYGGVATFDRPYESGDPHCGRRPVEYRIASGRRTVVRVGIDLFAEARHLLEAGQPVGQALSPTLEWHIARLRSLLVDAGVPLVEVPPRPYGYDYTCCLTHDLDFYGIRRQGLDRTLLGFLYRASAGTLVDLLRGRRTVAEAARNAGAVARLPLVLTGIVGDFWNPVRDYATVEPCERSTFFVVPVKHAPGVAPDGTTQPTRAVAYQASDISDELRASVSRGSEVAVHGIDAWRDTDAALAERSAVASASSTVPAGVRMHWLYWNHESPRRLEAAGFSFDSTCGFNETIGYRAGTSQVFRPFTANTLLELPLSIMDSSLLFPGRMNLPKSAALGLCRQVLSNARRFGGTVVINWHDRSLVPERLWDDVYRQLLAMVETEGRPWFATASRAVDWFRWRRTIRFTRVGTTAEATIDAAERPAGVPPAVIATYRAGSLVQPPVQEHSFDGAAALAAPHSFAC